MKSLLEKNFEQLLKLRGVKGFTRELKFCPTRRWRFDFAWIDEKVAVEIEGGIFMQGRHNRGKGMEADMEKYNWATINGWRVLRYSGSNFVRAILDLKIILEK